MIIISDSNLEYAINHKIICLILFTLTACTDTSEDKPQPTSQIKTETNKKSEKRSSAQKQKPTIQVTYDGQQYDLVPVGKCEPGDLYMFWAKKPESVNVTGPVGPRLHFIGTNNETVVKFYLEDKLLVSQVLSGEEKIVFDQPTLNFTINSNQQNSLEVYINCPTP